MLTKTKRFLFLTSGLAGALIASSAAGVVLASCSLEAVSDGDGTNPSDDITLPDTWYSKDINWTDATSLNGLITDSDGFVYSNKYMTEIIAVLPSFKGGSITIPDYVTTISGYNKITTDESGNTVSTPTGAFEGLTSITGISFASSKLTTVGARAFYGCTGLQKVSLPSTVTLVDTNAFNGCINLTSINLNSVQYIGINAFANAMTDVPTGSVSLNLNNAAYIASGAFIGAIGIGSVDFSKNKTLTQIAESAFEDCIFLSGDIDLSNATRLMTIGSSTAPTTTGSSFKNTAITNFYLSSTAALRVIATDTFSGCNSLVTVGPKSSTGFTSPSGITTIGQSAFYGTKIESINLSNITATNPLHSGAFQGMTALTSVDLGTTITTLPDGTFADDTALTTISLPASITSISAGAYPTITDSDASVSLSRHSAFHNTGLTTIDLSNVTSYSTTANQTLDLPTALFFNCTKLTTVTLKKGTTSIGDIAFYGATSLKTVTEADTTGTGFIASSTMTIVGKGAFYGSGIESANLTALTNSTYTNVLANSFSGCTSLTTVSLPAQITTIDSYAFSGDPALTTINFTDLTNLTTIENYNFYNCSSLSDIDLSNTKITALNISNNTVSLFSGISSSANVKLPSTLWNIGSTGIFSYTTSSSNEDGSTSTTTTSLPITFPKGFAPSNSTTNMTNGNLINHTMFSRISGALDMSSFTELKSIATRTFFDGSNVGSLTFNASSFASGTIGTSSSPYTYLGFIGSFDTGVSTLEYKTENLPFGNMTNLSTITFGSFTNSDSASTATGALAKTTADTWSQVTRIINSFGKESQEAASATTTNLTAWGEISADVTSVVSYEVANDTSSNVTSVSLQTTGGQELVTISDSTTTASFTYADLTWNVTVDASSGKITLSASDANTYRAVTGTAAAYSTSYKAFFTTSDATYTPSEGGTATTVVVPGSSISLTLNVVA